MSCYYDPDLPNVPGRALAPDELRTPTKIFHWWFYAVMGFWHLLAAFAEPPATKPDLWIVVNACVGCVGFVVCYVWCTWQLILESGLLNDYFEHSAKYIESLMGGEEVWGVGEQQDGVEKEENKEDAIAVQSPGSEEKVTPKGKGKGGKKRR